MKITKKVNRKRTKSRNKIRSRKLRGGAKSEEEEEEKSGFFSGLFETVTNPVKSSVLGVLKLVLRTFKGKIINEIKPHIKSNISGINTVLSNIKKKLKNYKTSKKKPPFYAREKNKEKIDALASLIPQFKQDNIDETLEKIVNKGIMVIPGFLYDNMLKIKEMEDFAKILFAGTGFNYQQFISKNPKSSIAKTVSGLKKGMEIKGKGKKPEYLKNEFSGFLNSFKQDNHEIVDEIEKDDELKNIQEAVETINDESISEQDTEDEQFNAQQDALLQEQIQAGGIEDEAEVAEALKAAESEEAELVKQNQAAAGNNPEATSRNNAAAAGTVDGKKIENGNFANNFNLRGVKGAAGKNVAEQAEQNEGDSTEIKNNSTVIRSNNVGDNRNVENLIKTRAIKNNQEEEINQEQAETRENNKGEGNNQGEEEGAPASGNNKGEEEGEPAAVNNAAVNNQGAAGNNQGEEEGAPAAGNNQGEEEGAPASGNNQGAEPEAAAAPIEEAAVNNAAVNNQGAAVNNQEAAGNNQGAEPEAAAAAPIEEAPPPAEGGGKSKKSKKSKSKSKKSKKGKSKSKKSKRLSRKTYKRRRRVKL